jgi:hypothetical protein
VHHPLGLVELKVPCAAAYDWVSAAEFENEVSAATVSARLSSAGVPNRVVADLPWGSSSHWIWVPPTWLDQAKKLIATLAVDNDDLTREALSFPPPDDL